MQFHFLDKCPQLCLMLVNSNQNSVIATLSVRIGYSSSSVLYISESYVTGGNTVALTDHFTVSLTPLLRLFLLSFQCIILHEST